MTGKPFLTEREREQVAGARSYLDRLPYYSEFALPNDKIDGAIPSAKLGHWRDLLDILRGEDFQKTKNDMIFRGQRGHNWQLSSTLGRLFPGGAIPKNKSDELLQQFKLAMRGRGYVIGSDQPDEEVWSVGQHYGLCTPLLDWTRSPFVALFFAFQRSESEFDALLNPARALFCLNMTKIKRDLGDAAEQLFVEPGDHRNDRLVNQSGLYTLAPGSNDHLSSDSDDNLVTYLINALEDAGHLPQGTGTEHEKNSEDGANFVVDDSKRAIALSAYVFKLHVPNDPQSRTDCLETLRQMNIHNGNLFPDPSGASLYCNDWLDRLLSEENAEARIDRDDKRKERVAKVLKEGDFADVEDQIRAVLVEIFSDREVEGVNEANLAKRIIEAARYEFTVDWHLSKGKRSRVSRAINRVLAEHVPSMKTLLTRQSTSSALLRVILEDAKRMGRDGL